MIMIIVKVKMIMMMMMTMMKMMTVMTVLMMTMMVKLPINSTEDDLSTVDRHYKTVFNITTCEKVVVPSATVYTILKRTFLHFSVWQKNWVIL